MSILSKLVFASLVLITIRANASVTLPVSCQARPEDLKVGVLAYVTKNVQNNLYQLNVVREQNNGRIERYQVRLCDRSECGPMVVYTGSGTRLTVLSFEKPQADGSYRAYFEGLTGNFGLNCTLL